MKPKNNIIESYKLFLTKMVDFHGRTRRSDFWQVFLINTGLIYLLPLLLAVIAKTSTITAGLVMGIEFVTTIIIAIAQTSLIVRRVHDIGKSGMFALLIVVTYLFTPLSIGGIILSLIFLTKDSQPGANAYGESPKYFENNQFDNNFEQDPIVKICPVCNYEVTDGSIICPQCGTLLGGPTNNG